MRLLIIGLLATSLGGCGVRALECTAMGCERAVDVRLGSLHERFADEMPLTIEGCAGKGCQIWIVDNEARELCKRESPGLSRCSVEDDSISLMLVHDQGPEDVSVAVTIRSKDGATLFEKQASVAVEPFYPNGYECDKNSPCYTASVDFSVL